MRTAPLRFGIALLIVAAAIPAGLVAGALGMPEVELPSFLMAVAIAVWTTGTGPGMVAVVVAAVTFNYLFLPPLYTLAIAPGDRPIFGAFIAFALVIAAFSARRRRVERELRDVQRTLVREVAERTRQASLLDLTHDSIFARDMDDVITYWNRGAEELYGWTASEAIGARADALLRTTFPVPAETIHAQLLRTGRWDGELGKTRADGARVTVVSRWSLQRSPSGKPIAILETDNDITERHRRDEEIRALNADLESRTVELQASNAELEAFAYSVSHDLRAPLRHVAGYAALLGKSAGVVLDDASRRYLTLIVDAAKRMGNLIDDLLTFSRIGRATTRASTVSLGALVREVIDEMRPETGGRPIDWQIGPLPEVHADRTMLRLVLVNLLSNAVKFTRERPDARIEVGSWPTDDGQVCVFVRDNGVGFDMRYADKLFRVFQRLHPTDTFEGTGIGLATVGRIVRRHGGRVTAEASVGGGATFYFSLPRADRRST